MGVIIYMNINEDELKSILLDYSFYNEDGQLTVVLNKSYLKHLFKADVILLEETFENRKSIIGRSK